MLARTGTLCRSTVVGQNNRHGRDTNSPLQLQTTSFHTFISCSSIDGVRIVGARTMQCKLHRHLETTSRLIRFSGPCTKRGQGTAGSSSRSFWHAAHCSRAFIQNLRASSEKRRLLEPYPPPKVGPAVPVAFLPPSLALMVAPPESTAFIALDPNHPPEPSLILHLRLESCRF
jgi:hypothetical protein